MVVNLISGAFGCAIIVAVFASWALIVKTMRDKKRIIWVIMLKYALLIAAFYLLAKFNLINFSFLIGSVAGVVLIVCFALAMHSLKSR